jgi:hypothetical protein
LEINAGLCADFEIGVGDKVLFLQDKSGEIERELIEVHLREQGLADLADLALAALRGGSKKKGKDLSIYDPIDKPAKPIKPQKPPRSTTSIAKAPPFKKFGSSKPNWANEQNAGMVSAMGSSSSHPRHRPGGDH